MQRLIKILCALLVPVCAVSQQPSSRLVIPNTPAFSILEFEPTSVMRPSSNKDLATDILNSFDENGKLLTNLGLEVSPYWLQSHPKLDRKTYLEPDAWQAIKQSFALSAATVRDTATGGNRLGMGVRFRVLNGRPVDSLKILETAFAKDLKIMSLLAIQRVRARTRQEAVDFTVEEMSRRGVSTEKIESFKRRASGAMPQYSDSRADVMRFVEEMETFLEEENTSLASRLADMQEQRKGFVLEFAAAGGFHQRFQQNVQRFGIWANASHYISQDDLFTLTARYMHANADTAQNNVDIGVAFLKKSHLYNISVEGMLRWYSAGVPDVNQNNEPITRLDKSFTYRLAVQGSYFISQTISINLSLGKEFDSPFIDRTGFFSILGLNFSLFSKPSLALPQEEK